MNILPYHIFLKTPALSMQKFVNPQLFKQKQRARKIRGRRSDFRPTAWDYFSEADFDGQNPSIFPKELVTYFNRRMKHAATVNDAGKSQLVLYMFQKITSL